MTIRFGDISERLRDEIDNDIEILHFQNPKNSKFEKSIIRYFEKLERSDINLYNQVLGLLLADTYKLLNVKKIDKILTKNEKEKLEFYEEFNNDTAVSFLELNTNELITSVYNMSEFNSYDYFMKRSILADSKDKLGLLCKLSVFSIYDYLYYCQKYELETLKAIYNEDLNEGYSKNAIISKLVNTINELATFDRENFKDIIIELLTNYYLLYQNNKIKKKHYNTLVPYMECNNAQDILNYLNDDRVKADILKSYINYDGDINLLEKNEEDKVFEKIKKIKEI